MNDNTCIFCGDIIPEGRQVCPVCEMKAAAQKRKDEKRRKKSSRDIKYNRENIIQKVIAFNRKNSDDMKILDYLKSKKSASGYIKSLILADIKKQKMVSQCIERYYGKG